MKNAPFLPKDFLVLEATLTVAEAMLRLKDKSFFGPKKLTQIIVKRLEGDQVYFYLYWRSYFEETLSRFALSQQSTLKEAFQLHEYTSTNTILVSDVEKLKNEDLRMVVLDNGNPVGYILEKETLGAKPADKEDDGLESFPPTAEPSLKPPPDAPPFEAYPFISDPGEVKPGAKFSIDVGYIQELSDAFKDVQKISIAHPGEDDYIEVILQAIGAEVTNNTMKKLPLDIDAKVAFHCVAHPDAQAITLIATYFYKRQSVSTFTRVLNGASKAQDANFSLPKSEPDSQVDLTVNICWDETAQRMHWSLTPGNPFMEAVSFDIKVTETRDFAASLSNQLDPNVNSGRAAVNILETLGQFIGELIPAAFFQTIKQIYMINHRIPRVLILTNDPYIPWELAYHDDLSLDNTVKPILHLQTCIGRWLFVVKQDEPDINMPPTSFPVQKVSVVATDYSSNPGITELLEAENEKKFLVSNFKAEAVKAEQDSLLDLTGKKPHTAGHLLHMALHGESKANLNEQQIILEDGKPLSATALFGAYNRGKEPPSVSFMFLNACQVGTAGKTLSQASGFPGIMLAKGMLGFIAPLWSVDDVPARNFSENFYNKALGEGRPVGEVLLELRRGVDYTKSLTELAYIYYGHPALKLNKSF